MGWERIDSKVRQALVMAFKVKRVAVIGAGVSGVVTAKHLKSSGLEVVVYERSSTIGGIWCEVLALGSDEGR